MNLDDGRMLIGADRYDALLKENGEAEMRRLQLVRVSPKFKVIALGLPVPRFPGNPLDPPLRSRFQVSIFYHLQEIALRKVHLYLDYFNFIPRLTV